MVIPNLDPKENCSFLSVCWNLASAMWTSLRCLLKGENLMSKGHPVVSAEVIRDQPAVSQATKMREDWPQISKSSYLTSSRPPDHPSWSQIHEWPHPCPEEPALVRPFAQGRRKTCGSEPFHLTIDPQWEWDMELMLQLKLDHSVEPNLDQLDLSRTSDAQAIIIGCDLSYWVRWWMVMQQN